MEPGNITQPLDSFKKVLIFFGLWNTKESWGLIQVLHFTVIPGIFCVGYFIAMTVNLAHAKKIEEVSEGLYITLTMVSLIARMANFIVKQNKFMAYSANLRSPILMAATEDEIQLFRTNFSKFNKLARLFIAATYGIIIAGCFYSLLSEQMKLPFPAWYPFDWKNKRAHFWIAFTYQTLAASCSGAIHAIFDLAHGYLFLQVSIFYRLLSMRLQAIGHMHVKDRQIDRSKAVKDLKECIRMHQFVNKLAYCAQDIWTVPIAMQICISGIIICFIIFHLCTLSPITDMGLYLFNIFYLSTMITEIFLPCFYGNEITRESELVSTAVYSSNWTEMSQEYKKLMICFMESLKKPKVLTAGGYFQVGLEAMVSVLQNAYSLFALLKSMKA